MKKTLIFGIFFVIFLIMPFYACSTNTVNENGEENTLDGYWELDTFNIIYAADSNTAQKLKKLWVDNQIGFRIIEDKMRLYFWTNKPISELDSGISVTEITEESDCFKIYYSEDLDDGRIKISVYPYIGYTEDDGIDLTLYWTKENNKLSCLYKQDQLYCIAEMEFNKLLEE